MWSGGISIRGPCAWGKATDVLPRLRPWSTGHAVRGRLAPLAAGASLPTSGLLWPYYSGSLAPAFPPALGQVLMARSLLVWARCPQLRDRRPAGPLSHHVRRLTVHRAPPPHACLPASSGPDTPTPRPQHPFKWAPTHASRLGAVPSPLPPPAEQENPVPPTSLLRPYLSLRLTSHYAQVSAPGQGPAGIFSVPLSTAWVSNRRSLLSGHTPAALNLPDKRA